MQDFDTHSHGEQIYQTKNLNEVSWYQPTPVASLEFVQFFKLPKTAKIIDIGGGDEYLVDHLLGLGYQDITILDISETAIEKAKAKVGDKGHTIKWIVADVTQFKPKEQYDFWHDRAAFHFLTGENEIKQYIEIVQSGLSTLGVVVIGTLSENGPEKCSGIQIRQYLESSMTSLLADFFKRSNASLSTIRHLLTRFRISLFPALKRNH